MEFTKNYENIFFDKSYNATLSMTVRRGEAQSRGIYITLTENSTTLAPTTETLKILGIKPDGKRFEIEGIIENDRFRIDLSLQAVAVSGVVRCELWLFGANGEALSDKRDLLITVRDSLMDEYISLEERHLLDVAFQTLNGILPRIEALDMGLLETYQGNIAEVSEALVAHKEDYTNLKGVNDGVVTPEMTQFIEIPTNLINNKSMEFGKTIDRLDGSLVDFAGASVSNFIKVKTGWKVNTNKVDRMAFYDKDYSFITTTVEKDYVIVNDNIAYMRFVVLNVSLHLAQANFGNELLPFSEHYYKLGYDKNIPLLFNLQEESISNKELKANSITYDKTNLFDVSNNLLNNSSIQENVSIDIDGTEISDSSRWLSDFIKVTPEETLHITSGSFRVGIYDSNKNWVARGGFSGIDNYTISTLGFYIRLSSTFSNNPETVMVNRGVKLLPFEPYGVKLKNEYLPEYVSSTPISNRGLGVLDIIEDTGLYASGEAKEVADIPIESEVDIIELSSNNIKTELQIYFKDKAGAHVIYNLLSNDGGGSVDNTLENMQIQGSPIIDFIEFDDVNKKFKISIKNLKCPHGLKVVCKNNHINDVNISIRVVARKYD